MTRSKTSTCIGCGQRRALKYDDVMCRRCGHFISIVPTLEEKLPGTFKHEITVILRAQTAGQIEAFPQRFRWAEMHDGTFQWMHAPMCKEYRVFKSRKQVTA